MPRLAPSSLNSTLATPVLSEALAATVIVPETIVPAVGVVIAMDGGVVSGTDARAQVTRRKGRAVLVGCSVLAK
ncbi:MAG: hypothetical protein E6K82_20325 [Candidatus Rokuibacteriota bacterium]|nr:MAG: hypothetical protein E6K82_20325 [Candidatus Rokubacteria bacterium]